VALAQLWAAGIGWDRDLPPVLAADPAELVALERQLERNVACVPSSSMGRLFDAVSSLVGVRHVATYEAEAAIQLEALAEAHLAEARPYRMSLDGGPLLKEMVHDLRAGVPAGAIAAGFHLAVADLVADLAVEWSPEGGMVALCGGVWQNVLLLELTESRLQSAGRTVLTHRLVPSNDGGLALGQLVVSP
jgi:hydrogenase maturation protein HypF